MEITLKRIKKDSFDELLEHTLEIYAKKKELIIDEEYVQNCSEIVYVSGVEVKCSFELEQYNEIVSRDDKGYNKLADIGMLLHKELRTKASGNIPKNILYEKEIWAYLSLTIFKDIVKKLRLDDDEKMNEDKIARFYFNVRGISRTGLFFLWCMIDRLESENNYKMSHVAFEFIDPVKAIFERTMSKNPKILQAFTQGIINNECDRRFKNKVFKLKVPNNISCLASITMLDSLDYDSLVNVITEQQKMILNT